MWRPWNIPCSWAFTGYVMFSCGDLEIFSALGHSQVLWCSHVETLKYSLFFSIHRFCDVLMWKPWNIPFFCIHRLCDVLMWLFYSLLEVNIEEISWTTAHVYV
jgi:hypothetical protein